METLRVVLLLERLVICARLVEAMKMKRTHVRQDMKIKQGRFIGASRQRRTSKDTIAAREVTAILQSVHNLTPAATIFPVFSREAIFSLRSESIPMDSIVAFLRPQKEQV